MTQTDKYQTTDKAALYFSIAFIGLMLLLAALWLWDIVGDLLIKLESTLF